MIFFCIFLQKTRTYGLCSTIIYYLRTKNAVHSPKSPAGTTQCRNKVSSLFPLIIWFDIVVFSHEVRLQRSVAVFERKSFRHCPCPDILQYRCFSQPDIIQQRARRRTGITARTTFDTIGYSFGFGAVVQLLFG